MAGPFTYIQNVMPIVCTVTLNPVIPFIRHYFIQNFHGSHAKRGEAWVLVL